MKQNQMSQTGYSLEKNKVEAQKPLEKTGGNFLRKAIRVVEQTMYVKNYFKKTRQDAREAVRAGKIKLNQIVMLSRSIKLSKFFISCIVVVIMVLQTVNAQNDEKFKYRRSSLSMVLVSSDDFVQGYKDTVLGSWNNYPFPDKYDKHEIGLSSIDVKDIEITLEEWKSWGYYSKKDTLKTKALVLAAISVMKDVELLKPDSSLCVVLPSEKVIYQKKIEKVIQEWGIAKKLVATWFNRKSDGSFDMELVGARGMYNATEMEAAIAKNQIQGMSLITDAGEELIKNTFITFTTLNFVENGPIAEKIRTAAYLAAAITPSAIAQVSMRTAADLAYDIMKDGWSLYSKTWLFRLKWNDSIAEIFYNTMWNNPEAFDKTDLFELEFVGVQYNSSMILDKMLKSRTKGEILDKVIVRNLDNAFVKLQKNNEAFRVKIPVLAGVPPITAQIGTKEGVKPSSIFQVLEMKLDPNTGKTTYSVVGKVKPDKTHIWDNRYKGAPIAVFEGKPVTEEEDDIEIDMEEKGEEKVPPSANPNEHFTVFKGAKNVQPGMLLRQLK